jgi:hypothetical protein
MATLTAEQYRVEAMRAISMAEELPRLKQSLLAIARYFERCAEHAGDYSSK